jgi:predicted DNA-binding protein YlxM (UPF0122 family)
MSSTPKWICVECGQTLTRYTSGKRHNTTLHSDMALIVEYTEYLIGLATGKYKPPKDSPKTFRRKKSLIDNSSNLDIGNSINPNFLNYNYYNNFKDKNYDIDYSMNDPISLERLSPEKLASQQNLPYLDSMIEKYENKLKGFLPPNKINELMNQIIITAMSTCIDNKKRLDRLIEKIDRVVAFIRITKRREDYTPN